MADARSLINATIGGQPANVFTGTPGMPGTSIDRMEAGAINAVSNFNPVSTITNLLSGSDSGNITDTITGTLDGLNPLGAAKNAVSGLGAEIKDLFFRAVIIILGFIFMAVGLSMFKQPIIVQAKDTIKKGVGHIKKVKK